MEFELLFVITSGNDAVNADTAQSGSYSYCGIKGQEYPDKRAMGFPIDRRVPDNRLFKQPNIKWTTVKIFHKDDH